MDPFTIFVLGEQLDLTELRLALMSFALMGEQVTPKHRRKMELALFANKGQLHALGAILPGHVMEDQVTTIQPHELQKAEALFLKSSVFFFPSKETQAELLLDAMALGLPVLAFGTSGHAKIIDNTCGLLVSPDITNAASEFAELLQMLYFDQEACKIMKRAASKKAVRSEQKFSLSPSHLLSA